MGVSWDCAYISAKALSCSEEGRLYRKFPLPGTDIYRRQARIACRHRNLIFERDQALSLYQKSSSVSATSETIFDHADPSCGHLCEPARRYRRVFCRALSLRWLFVLVGK